VWCDILLVVAHPDDDALFAGELQRRLGMFTWGVVCVTYQADSVRARELVSWQRALGTLPENLHFLGLNDDPSDITSGHSSFSVDEVAARLRELSLSCRLVVTHDVDGEYGHPHHAVTHAAACMVFSDTPRLHFVFQRRNRVRAALKAVLKGPRAHPDIVLTGFDKTGVFISHYVSQAAISTWAEMRVEGFRWGQRETAQGLAWRG
jgi:LmbE family N-acetylglucosaminyl deacetylase